MRPRLFTIGAGAALLAVAAADTAQAAGKKRSECEIQDYTPERITNINASPSYFAKVTADGRYMCYIAKGNFVMDLDNPSTLVRVPGPYDPVPAPPVGPGNRVEHLSAPDHGEMMFYKMSEVTGAMEPGKTVDLSSGGIAATYVDNNNYENYQSIGVLPGTHNQPVYRMLTGSLSINDYDTRTTPWTKTRSGRVCGYSGRYQLPMLSKDGQEISVYDTHEGVTKIMALKDDGSCEEEINLGIPTGKVEFSYDNKAIAFHVDSFSTDSEGHTFSGVNPSVTKNIYVMQIDRSSGQPRATTLRRITANQEPGQGSYYPSWTQDGKIVYVHGERDLLNNVHYSFRTVDPRLAPEVANPLVSPNCATCNKDRAASLALGLLWSNVCTKLGDQLSATDASLWTLSLEPAACRKLVHEKWDEMRASVLHDDRLLRSGISASAFGSLNEGAVVAACPSAASAPRPPARTITQESGKSLVHHNETGPQVFENRCRSCHTGGSAVNFNWDHLTLDQVNSMLIAIDNGSMPREQVSDREQTLRPLVEALRLRRQDLEANEQ